MKGNVDIIVMGGSSGCIPVLTGILNALPAEYRIPIVIVIHRMRNVKSELNTILSSEKNIREPEDKDPVSDGCIFLAPQNYHLLIENDRTFSMDYSELVNYSRPSIDVTFVCAAEVYKHKALAILLSGANSDGADGIDTIIRNGGRGIVQDPATSEYPSMPDAAIKKNARSEIQDPATIVNSLLSLQNDQ